MLEKWITETEARDAETAAKVKKLAGELPNIPTPTNKTLSRAELFSATGRCGLDHARVVARGHHRRTETLKERESRPIPKPLARVSEAPAQGLRRCVSEVAPRPLVRV